MPDLLAQEAIEQHLFRETLAQFKEYFLSSLGQSKPSCIISYAWGIADDELWVQYFAENLKAAGLTVYLDIWYDEVGKDLCDFLGYFDLKITDYIIPVGTPLYREKADKRSIDSHTPEHVVAFEVKLINHFLRFNTQTSRRVKPVVLNGNVDTALPYFMSKQLACDFTRNNPYDEFFKLLADLCQINRNHEKFREIELNFFARIGSIAPVGEKILVDYAAVIQTYKNERANKLAKAERAKRAIEHCLSETPRLFMPSLNTIEIYNVPAPHRRFGNSRKEQLKKLYHDLDKGQSKENWNIVKIVGMPGIGKSQLAKKFAYLQQTYYQNRCWFIDASNKDSILEAFKEKVELFGLNQTHLPKLVKSVYASLAAQGQKTLVIFDNIKKRSDLKSFLSEDFPNKMPFDIILTTQHHNTYSSYLPIINLKLNDINIRQDTSRFIKDFFADKQLIFSETDIDNLLIRLDYHPLAVEQAALYIQRRALNIKGYLDLYNKTREKLLNYLTEDNKLPALATLKLALDELKETNNTALDMLYTCAYLASSKIPAKQLKLYFAEQLQPLIKQDIENTKEKADEIVEDAILLLREHSLIELNQEASAFDIHRLMQETMQIQAEKSEKQPSLSRELKKALENAINSLCKKIVFEQEPAIGRSTNFIQKNFRYLHNDKNRLSQLHDLLPHAQQVIEHANRLHYASSALFQLIYSIGIYFQTGEYSIDKAKNYLAQAEKLARTIEITIFEKYKLYRQLSKIYLRNAYNAVSNNRKAELFAQALQYLQQATSSMVDISFISEEMKHRLEIEHKCDWANFYIYKIEYFDNHLITKDSNNSEIASQTTKVRAQEKTNYQVAFDGKLALDEALQLAEYYNDNDAKGMIYHYWGAYYAHSSIKQYDNAIDNYKKAISYKKQFATDRELARSYCQLGSVWLKKFRASDKNEQNLNKALSKLIKGLKCLLIFHDSPTQHDLTHLEILDGLGKLATCYSKYKRNYQFIKALQIRLLVSTSLSKLNKVDSANDKKIIKLYIQVGHYAQAKRYLASLKSLSETQKKKFGEMLKGKQKYITNFFDLSPIRQIDFSVEALQTFLDKESRKNPSPASEAFETAQQLVNNDTDAYAQDMSSNNKRKAEHDLINEQPVNKKYKTLHHADASCQRYPELAESQQNGHDEYNEDSIIKADLGNNHRFQQKMPQAKTVESNTQVTATEQHNNSSSSKARAGLFRGHKQDHQAKQLIGKSLPASVKLGTALDTGDCFFDAVAQSLNSIEKGIYSAKSLRQLCHQYVVDLDKKGKSNDNWIYQRFLGDAKRLHPTDDAEVIRAAAKSYQHYMANIQYTAAEIEAGLGLNCTTAIWGEQDIDGRTLREKLGIKLHVLELIESEQGLIIGHQLEGKSVTETEVNYTSLDTAHIAVFNQHFVPILAEITLIDSNKQSVTSKPQSSTENEIMYESPHGLSTIPKIAIFATNSTINVINASLMSNLTQDNESNVKHNHSGDQLKPTYGYRSS